MLQINKHLFKPQNSNLAVRKMKISNMMEIWLRYNQISCLEFENNH